MALGVNQHPFYKPLWRRIAIVAVTASWVGLEIVSQDGFFLVVAMGFFAYSVWAFLLKYKHQPES